MKLSATANWKWAFVAAIAITILSQLPQFLMWGSRGAEWNGTYAELHGDEWVYSAYVQALIDGRPRRNDAYTGRDNGPTTVQPESLFSIQFVPAYAIAMPARVLGVSSSTAFIVLGILAPFFSCLAIFWLLTNLIQDRNLAAAGSLIVLCLGGFAAGEGLVHLLISGDNYSFLPFLRRYEPVAPFPLFFLFCVMVWKVLNDRDRVVLWAIAAGLLLAMLIFSYFFLWTTAAAWLACLVVLWFIAYPAKLRQNFKPLAIIVLLAVAALVPYAVLISRRSDVMDVGQKLTLSHAPDLLRMPELIGLVTILLLLIGCLRRGVNWRAPEVLFTASFAITPVLVFNQQIITGRSLQPFHYGWFIANYLALIGLMLAIVIVWRGANRERQPARYRWAGRVAFLAIWWAGMEVMAPAKVIIRDSEFTDRAAAVCQRLRQRAATDTGVVSSATDPRPLVLATENKVAVILPTFAPQALLWAPHFDFLHLAKGESHERFYEWLYFTGVDPDQFAVELGKPMSTFAAAAFGHERVLPDLSVQVRPITAEELALQVADYKAYYSSFTKERASEHILSYVIVPAAGGPNLSNLDRWYQRDAGEQVGDHILYRVQLRP